MTVVNCAGNIFRAPDPKSIRNGRRARFAFYSGFTLIELLVVIAIIAVLAAILFPVFASAKESGKQARCAAQLKQLASAALSYADDYSGRYVPAARDIYASNPTGGHWRWHGYRDKSKTDFDPTKGPLWKYLSRSSGIKMCPDASTLKNLKTFSGAFEPGGGGYGYNALYVGGTYYKNSLPQASEIASTTSDIASPSRTVMFADTAIAMSYKGSDMLVEYSFVEPPYTFNSYGDPPYSLEKTDSPTIHFRHNGRANIAWCDGHVTSESMNNTGSTMNAYGCDNQKCQLGWFGPQDNSLFDNR